MRPPDAEPSASPGQICLIAECASVQPEATAAYQASTVFAPLALALFIIAIMWPLQSWLQARMPGLVALAITMTVTVAASLAFASLVAWGFGLVGHSILADSARYQALYDEAIAWLED